MRPAPVLDSEKIHAVASLLRSMGARDVFVFGSVTKGHLRRDSDVDIAVTGLPAKDYFSAVSKSWDILGRPVDLVDLDDPSPRVRYLAASGELIRVA